MNIVQAYTKFNGQNIILISGFSGSNKSKYAKFIAELFKYQIVDLTKFYKSLDEYDKPSNYEELKDGTKILRWDDVERSVDWNKFNSFIDANKRDGVVVYGFGFPVKMLKFAPNFHLLVKISKQNLVFNRENFIRTHSTDGTDIQRKIEQDRLIMNYVSYPVRMKIDEETKYDKIVNTNDKTEEEIKDDIFMYFMNVIGKWIEEYNSKNIQQKHSSVGREDKMNEYDEFYYPNKTQKPVYDFNDEGDEYHPEYIKKQRQLQRENQDDSSSTDDSSDSYFLYTSSED